MRRTSLGVWTLMAAVFLGACAASSWAAAADNTSALELGLRFSELAQLALQVPGQPMPAHYRETAALLTAARRCDPNEPRYLRLLADALLELRDNDRAIEALEAFRKLRPDDRVSQLQVLELYASRMETVQQQLRYLADLLGREAIPKDVRAVAAVRCAGLMEEQGRRDDAGQMLETALKLDPLNLAALRRKYEMTARAASGSERVTMLLAMLRSNPGQPDVLRDMARELAEAGMVKESIAWHRILIDLATRTGSMLPPDVGLYYGSELLIDGQVEPARKVVEQLLRANPEDYSALILAILIENRAANAIDKQDASQNKKVPDTQPSQRAADKWRTQARGSLLNSLAIIRKMIGVAQATTRPIAEDQRVPDLGGDLEKFKACADQLLRGNYLMLIEDLAWFEVYFDSQPAEAEKLLRLLNALVAEEAAKGDGEYVRRMEKAVASFDARVSGWIFLSQGKPAEAKVKLSAAAADDPLADLGLLRTYSTAETARAKEAATKLLSAHPAGLLAALLIDGIRQSPAGAGMDFAPGDRTPVGGGLKSTAPTSRPVRPGADAPAITTSLRMFPGGWLGVLERPQRFCAVRAEPLKVVHGYDEPLMVRVTVQNVGDQDITIGPEGTLNNKLVFDAQLSGLVRGALSGIAVADITEHMVLKPRQSLSQVVRFDQGALTQVLRVNPTVAIAIDGSVSTNVLSPAETRVPGYSIGFARIMERSNTPFDADRPEKLLEPVLTVLETGAARDRMRNLRLVAMIAQNLMEKEDDPKAVASGQALMERVRQSMKDADVNVRGWASFLYVVNGPEKQRPDRIRQMLNDPHWQVRMLGVVVSSALGQAELERQKQMIGELRDREQDPTVKELASALFEVLLNPPTTQPATTQPAAPPRPG